VTMAKESRDYWDFFIGETQRMRAPLYEKLTRGVKTDPDLRALAQNVRPGQPPMPMLFGAVHYLLLRGDEHPLRRFYPSLNGGHSLANEDPFPDFQDFVRTRRDAVEPLVRTRVTNTNEVGRSSYLNAAFRHLATETNAPLNLIEIGPSAGLNLFWDRYRTRYFSGARAYETDLPDAELTVSCEMRGERVPPLTAPPKVASRIGLELNPVDLEDADTREWLKALVWPDHTERFARLAKAIEICRREKPPIVAGDALALLPETLARVPSNETVCVYHTLVTYQFGHDLRASFDDMLTVMGLRRPVWRLALEWAGERHYPLLLTLYRDGTKTEHALAHGDGHGASIEWLM
jgi:hypothetical protein